jgi:hypothetical protein
MMLVFLWRASVTLYCSFEVVCLMMRDLNTLVSL